jgi:hemerythrin
MTRLFIIWDNSLNVGNLAIDTQHQNFIALINKLYESFVDQTTAYNLGRILEELVDYCFYHFRTEEELFQKYDYPNKEEHIAKHEEFALKIKEFQQNFEENKTAVTFQLMNYLRNWLLGHIKSEDQKYAGYFRSKGIKE